MKHFETFGYAISRKGPICPHCGHEHHADEALFYREGLLQEIPCFECGEFYEFTTRCEWTWTTYQDKA